MKFLFRAGRKAHSLAGRGLAHGFCLTGWRIFLSAYRWRRDLLLSEAEMFAIANSLRQEPGSFLVFGAGNDSEFWAILNHRAFTVFLEADSYWMERIGSGNQFLNLYQVIYNTRLSEMRLPKAEGRVPPALELPEEVRRQAWDLILVDAPQGWGEGPGRLQSIFEASRLIGPRGRIFVHDCDREGEQYLTGVYLCGFRCQPITNQLWLFQK